MNQRIHLKGKEKTSDCHTATTITRLDGIGLCTVSVCVNVPSCIRLPSLLPSLLSSAEPLAWTPHLICTAKLRGTETVDASLY